MGLLQKILPQATDLQRLMEEEKWEAAKQQLEYHPKEAKQWIEVTLDHELSTTMLPLHKAVMGYAPLDFIQRLIQCYPKAVLKKDVNFQRHPLHYACLHAPHTELIQCLLDHGGRPAAFHVDSYGRTALHYAAFGSASDYMFRLLLDVNPQAAAVADKQGWFPLHIAVRHCATYGVLETLVRAHPAALQAKTTKGEMTPHDLIARFQLTKLTSDPKCVRLLSTPYQESMRSVLGPGELSASQTTPMLLPINGEAV